MPHLPPAHHETSKHDSPNETKIKEKQNCPGFEFKPHQVNDSSQSNQVTDHLVSQSPHWWVHWQQKYKVWSLNPRLHEAQLEDPKAKKIHEKRQSQAKCQRRANKSSNSRQVLKIRTKAQNQYSPWNQLPLTLSMQALPLRYSFIMFLLSTTMLAKSSTNFVHIFSPFGNELIKHKPREEWDDMHENQH
jgi:hypothetical protein